MKTAGWPLAPYDGSYQGYLGLWLPLTSTPLPRGLQSQDWNSDGPFGAAFASERTAQIPCLPQEVQIRSVRLRIQNFGRRRE